MKRIVSVAALTLAVGTSTVAFTAEKLPPVAVFNAVLGCVGVSPDAKRLACFDQTVAALSAAQQRKEIVVADKGAIGEAKRSLFGFSLPKLRLFGDGVDGVAVGPVEAIDAQIASVGETSSGGLLLGLSSGARWTQIDPGYVNRPKVGQIVTIKRGSVGGYQAKIGNGRAFRVRRLSE